MKRTPECDTFGGTEDVEMIDQVADLIFDAGKEGDADFINGLAATLYANSVSKGFWEEDRSDGESIVLMHSELSEALEALRDQRGDKRIPSKKIEGFSLLEEEMADLMIRVLDYAGRNSLDVGGALIHKARYNRSRPHKHGKAF